jgi:hypothetical protein
MRASSGGSTLLIPVDRDGRPRFWAIAGQCSTIGPNCQHAVASPSAASVADTKSIKATPSAGALSHRGRLGLAPGPGPAGHRCLRRPTRCAVWATPHVASVMKTISGRILLIGNIFPIRPPRSGALGTSFEPMHDPPDRLNAAQ